MNDTHTNLTDQNATSVPGPEEHMAFKVTKWLVLLFILIVSMLGNCTVIAIICRSRIMRSVAGNFLILNLALCDFLTPFLSIPFDLAVEEKGEWLYGPIMCKVFWPAATWTTTSSSLTLAAIAFDRYRCLMHPFRNRLTITQVKRTLVSIHAFSLLVVIPYAYVLDVTEKNQCEEEHWFDPPSTTSRKVYTMSLFVFQYLAPLLFMTYMYSQTSKSLFTTTERVRSASLSSVESAASTDTPGLRRGSFSSVMLGNRAETPLSRTVFRNIQQVQNVKITKMFIGVVIIFAIFMLPNQALWLWADFGYGLENKNFGVASKVCLIFTYTNSCLNPLIFFKFSREFRRGFRRLIFGARCCVNQRRSMSLLYRKWRASRTASRTASAGATQNTTIGPSKSGQAFSSPTPSEESQTSTSSVFEKEERGVPVPVTNVSSPVGHWKKKMDDLKAGKCPGFLRAIKGKPKEVPISSRKYGIKQLDKAKVQSLTEEIKIEISIKDLMTLPQLVETCC